MKHELRHELPPALARRAAERAFESYRERYAHYRPVLRWLSDTRAEASFCAKGLTVGGTIELLPGRIALRLDVPFVLRVFKKRAYAVLERELAHWTRKAEAGEL